MKDSTRIFDIIFRLKILTTNDWVNQLGAWHLVGRALIDYKNKYNINMPPERELLHKNIKEIS